jgi:hypothetical protein
MTKGKTVKHFSPRRVSDGAVKVPRRKNDSGIGWGKSDCLTPSKLEEKAYTRHKVALDDAVRPSFLLR